MLLSDPREAIEGLRQMGFSGRQVAAAVGVTQEHVSRIRAGKDGGSHTLRILLHLITTNAAIREHVGLKL